MSTKVNNRAWLLVGGSVLITFVMTVAGCERKPILSRPKSRQLKSTGWAGGLTEGSRQGGANLRL
jgi:hypothetical protein